MDLAFDGAGNLFVLNLGNNTIQKFDAAGNGSLFAEHRAESSGKSGHPPVPEPAASGLLLLAADFVAPPVCRQVLTLGCRVQLCAGVGFSFRHCTSTPRQ